MKKYLVGVAVVALLGAVMAPAEAGNWSGFYIGANGGWSMSSVTDSETPWGVTGIADITPHSFRTSMNGAMFGGQAGYNWQMDEWVLGLEGDFDGASASGSRGIVFPSLLVPTNTDAFAVTEKLNWLASIRARIGWDLGPGFLYATGGAAWESKTDSGLMSANTAPAVFGNSALFKFSHTRSGFAVGAGYETDIAPNWTLRAEYLYYGFSSARTDTVTLPNCATATCGVFATTGVNNVNAIRVGVNYMVGP